MALPLKSDSIVLEEGFTFTVPDSGNTTVFQLSQVLDHVVIVSWIKKRRIYSTSYPPLLAKDAIYNRHWIETDQSIF